MSHHHGTTTLARSRCLTLLRHCTKTTQLKPIHALLVTQGLHENLYVITKLITSLTSVSTNLHYSSLLFNQLQNSNLFIYNTLIKAHSKSPHPQTSFHYFNLLLKEETITPNCQTFNFVLVACAKTSSLLSGMQIQNWVFKNGMFSSDSYVQTGVIRLYVEARLWDDARKVFDEIAYVDVVKWNVLMSGLIRCRLGAQALSVFKEMLVFGVEPDEFCLTTALTACAQSGSLWEGKWIHEYVKKRENYLELDVFIGTALVDMYAKCGCLDLAVEVFEGMSKRNVFSWAAMIGGFAVHGHARKAIHCLGRMQTDGIRPDGVVLLGVLTACTHAGLVEEGLLLLNNMEGQYRIVPKHEHYGCVVDSLCRVGKFDEALKLIRRMPMKPLASVWGALLNSCRIHNNVELAELAVKELLELEDCDVDEEDAALVQLSNIYFGAQKSEDGHRVRRMIGDRGLRKAPGCSMIEVDGRTTEFVSGDVSHPIHFQIHALLKLLFPGDPDTL
ncbi:pentatricopeptide repeat-containing protein At3g28660-like [Durio zibethinus]|uniref:Pentatricopeptide repeat-containing protein At3g28660-like n=1 Tax=Durio zibethinus TaxID=66656 RepID=A0A6P6BBJ3_DURZI|nr:pentatricopeptide repeat-containing protein At3g28660-like [Durio zibethinus]XP_022774477.1 pentatricopeptide repeat-containing protein At3g28660-like [Durio zibethinus]